MLKKYKSNNKNYYCKNSLKVGVWVLNIVNLDILFIKNINDLLLLIICVVVI